MCGIFGINKKQDQNLINKIINDNNHRGPDQNGFYQNDNLTLIHNRLSILDIEQGCQPMYYKDLVIIYNGEIFNSISLRKNLEEKGYVFESNNSDTEVLLKLYHLKGKNMVLDLNGMFSFVIYDKKNNILFGAVDRFSIKPLYYSINQNLFTFSSEIKTLLSLSKTKLALSKKSVYDYFQLQYVPFENTIYEDIKKLKNSNYFIYDLNLNSLQINKYKKKNQNYLFKNYNEIVEVGKDCLNNSVRNWSQSDVPISCSLSGGLDSSLISAIFAKNSTKRIQTITVGFDGQDKSYDERYYASKISDFIDSDHLEVVVNPNQILNNMDKIFENLSEPYGGSLASWFVYNNMNDNKVIFTGTGADEIFGNYGKWKNFTLSDFFVKNFYNSFLNQKISDLKHFYGFMYKKIFYFKDLNRLFLNCEKENNLIYKINSLVESDNYNTKKIIQEIDFNLQLPWEFLYITDRLSMLNSIETRTPFLDDEMISFINSVPNKHMGQMLNSKKLLKDIASNFIPKEIINRKKKGFVLPKENWLKNDLKNKLDYFSSNEFIKKQNIFSQIEINNLIEKFYKSKNKTDLVEKIWTFFIFQFWYEKNF